MPVEFDIASFRYRGPNRTDCFELFAELGFRSLLNEFAPTADTVAKDYAIVDDLERFARCAELRAAGRFALRVLPTSRSPMPADIVGIAVRDQPRARARYIPMAHRPRHAGGADADRRAALERARARARGPGGREGRARPEVRRHRAAPRHGVDAGGLEFDTMLASYLLDATRSAHAARGARALEHLGYKALTEEDVRGRGAKARPSRTLPADAVLDYAGERADLPAQLAGRLRARARRRAASTAVYRDLELPLVPVLVGIERAGVRVDTGALGRAVGARSSGS